MPRPTLLARPSSESGGVAACLDEIYNIVEGYAEISRTFELMLQRNNNMARHSYISPILHIVIWIAGDRYNQTLQNSAIAP